MDDSNISDSSKVSTLHTLLNILENMFFSIPVPEEIVNKYNYRVFSNILYNQVARCMTIHVRSYVCTYIFNSYDRSQIFLVTFY